MPTIDLERIATEGVEKYTKIVNDLKEQLNESPNEEELKKKLAEAEIMLTTFIKNMDEKSWEKVKKGDDSDSDDWEESRKK
jgi:hypothetical protein